MKRQSKDAEVSCRSSYKRSAWWSPSVKLFNCSNKIFDNLRTFNDDFLFDSYLEKSPFEDNQQAKQTLFPEFLERRTRSNQKEVNFLKEVKERKVTPFSLPKNNYKRVSDQLLEKAAKKNIFHLEKLSLINETVFKSEIIVKRQLLLEYIENGGGTVELPCFFFDNQKEIDVSQFENLPTIKNNILNEEDLKIKGQLVLGRKRKEKRCY